MDQLDPRRLLRDRRLMLHLQYRCLTDNSSAHINPVMLNPVLHNPVMHNRIIPSLIQQIQGQIQGSEKGTTIMKNSLHTTNSTKSIIVQDLKKLGSIENGRNVDSYNSNYSKKRKLLENHDSPSTAYNKKPTLSQCTTESSTGSSPDIYYASFTIPPSSVGLVFYEDNDVLCGRGGRTNVHSGNRYFRILINLNRRKYLCAKKTDKPGISRSIVRDIRKRRGRFLKKDEGSGLWFDIGDNAAREKTSQALRQRASDYRKVILCQNHSFNCPSSQQPISPSLNHLHLNGTPMPEHSQSSSKNILLLK